MIRAATPIPFDRSAEGARNSRSGCPYLDRSMRVPFDPRPLALSQSRPLGRL